MFTLYRIQLNLGVMIVSAILYYRIGKTEHDRGYLLALISIVLSILAITLLRIGVWGLLILQGLLYVALTIWNTMKHGKSG